MLVLGIANIGAVFWVVNGQKSDAQVLNDAGRLRMLSQKITKASLFIKAGDVSAQQEMGESITTFELTLNELIKGNGKLGKKPAPKTLQPQLEKVAGTWKSFESNLNLLLSTSSEDIAFLVVMEDVKAQNLVLLSEANAAVQMFEEEAEAKITILYSLLAIFLGLTIATFIGVFLSVKKAVNPVAELVEATRKVVLGDLSVHVNVVTEDEIGILGESFNGMVKSISQSNEDLEEEKNSVERKIERAIEQGKKEHLFLGQQVEYMLSAIEEFAQGDLAIRLRASDHEEIKKLFNGFNDALLNVEGMMKQVRYAVASTADVSTQIALSSSKLSDNFQEQAAQILGITAAVDQMSSTIAENSQLANKTAKIAENSSFKARESSQIVIQTVGKIQEIAEVMDTSTGLVHRLRESVGQIDSVLTVIKEIADQTNLLALNAAIEAARAGEQGKGFAVVADEVRKLAERTSMSTNQISEMIGAIRKEMKATVDSMNTGTKRVGEGIALAGKTTEALNEIEGNIDKTLQMVQRIADATSDQASTSRVVASNVTGMSTLASTSSESVAEISSIVVSLNDLTEELNKLSLKFKVSSDRNSVLS